MAHKRRVVAAVAAAAASVTAGLLAAAPANAVADGHNAPPGAFPFTVKFTMTDIPNPDGTTRSSACSGSLIAPQWVITAGHCFHDVNRNPVSGPVPYPTTATLGKVDLAESGGHTVAVTEVRQAPKGDIALAKLASPVTDVAPLLVNRHKPRVGQKLDLAGWGATDSVNPTPGTHMTYGQVAVSTVADPMLEVHGVSPAADTSACLYDSGAPYFVPAGLTAGVLVSVESDGPDCPHTTPETTTRVDVVADWIAAQVGYASVAANE
ncbi:trypsin-like serine protease [Kutzneria buriramensis]|uniref:Trypsin n=1 Tax=Kutzneria buriramensis TaxID=1045776 RepID=A0A3E0H3L3_9PSEU|nr:trypsin-like serine protease [Kutzneria buriramensis]REH37109.1 trypsin [Kutzneria buriramensis]